MQKQKHPRAAVWLIYLNLDNKGALYTKHQANKFPKEKLAHNRVIRTPIQIECWLKLVFAITNIAGADNIIPLTQPKGQAIKEESPVQSSGLKPASKNFLHEQASDYKAGGLDLGANQSGWKRDFTVGIGIRNAIEAGMGGNFSAVGDSRFRSRSDLWRLDRAGNNASFFISILDFQSETGNSIPSKGRACGLYENYRIL